MEIKEFLKQKKLMENEIAAEINKIIIGRFKKATGYTPNSISIYMTDTTGMGDDKRQHIVGAVKTGVEL